MLRFDLVERRKARGLLGEGLAATAAGQRQGTRLVLCFLVSWHCLLDVVLALLRKAAAANLLILARQTTNLRRDVGHWGRLNANPRFFKPFH